MAIELTDEPSLPLSLPTIRKLERVARRVLADDLHKRKNRPHRNTPLLPLLKGKLDEDLLHDDVATVSVWLRNDGGTEVDTTNNIEAYDWMLGSGKQLPSGARVVCARIGRAWYVIASDTCQEDQP